MITKERGLSSEEAKKKLEEYGPNEIKEVNTKSIIKIFLNQIKNNFILYLLMFAMIISFLIKEKSTAYVILLVILIISFVGFFQEYKAEKAINALKKMVMPISLVIRDGKETEINSNEIVPGDILILRVGERVPADCIILKENDLYVDESMITGESEAVKKRAIKNIDKAKDENKLFMGSYVVNGSVFAKVIETGMNTKFGKIASMISKAEKELPLQKKVNQIAKYSAIIGAILSLIAGILFLIHSDQINQEILVGALIVVIALCVAAFPEGFPVVLVTALASGAYRMAKKNAIVNRMSIIETLGETTVICTDKTGTITKGEMTVKKIVTSDRIYDLTGIGYEGNGKFFYNGREIDLKNEKTLNILINSAVFCNDSRIERIGEDNIYKIYGEPTEAALLIMGAKAGLHKEDINYERIEEISFNSERKMMTVLLKEKNKLVVYSKGATEILINKCKYIQKDSGVFRFLEKDKKRILKLNEDLNSQAFRTLSLAYKITNSNKKEEIEEDLIFLGFVAMEDPPRDEIKDALISCKNAGIKVKMITGDSKKTAISIARQIGLEEGIVIEGDELEKLSHKDLVKVVKDVTIFARVKPEHKLRIVKALKEHGEIVTMTGDGVNDAPALKEAHIGVAMGKNGTDVSRSVADLTLKDDNFATIVDAIKEGRTIYKNIQKFAAYQLSINFAQVMIILVAMALSMPLPLLAIQILFMNIFSDEILALTLAFNAYSKDVMLSKPRKKSNIINKQLLYLIILTGALMCLFCIAIFYYSYKHENIEEARTVVFVLMTFFAIANAFNFRSFRKASLNRSPFVNKSLFIASIFVIIITLLIVYIPSLNLIQLKPIKLNYWLLAIIPSFLFLLIFDILKKVNNKVRSIQ